MEASFSETTNPSFSAIRESIREKKCPCCHAENEPVNAFLTITVKSFLFYTSNRKEIIVGCSRCIASSAKKATAKSLLLGWWGFPLGPLSTIFALMHNWSAFDPAGSNEPDDELMNYILEKCGR